MSDQSKTSDLNLEQFAQNKQIPEALSKEVLTALSYYPELKDTRIRFVFKDNIRKSFMQAQPLIKSMFSGLQNREYVIFMSRFFKIGKEKIFIHTIPSEVIVGWVGHELGHVMDYKNRGFFSMIKFGIGYLISKAFIIGAERVADTYAIQHGLADKIIATKNFILNHSDLPEKYKDKIRKLYMPPEEVMMMVESKS
ncbi:hypothetical protein LVD15_22300 [Fulvivirga maritima]|uniref:hypothetical protein n=1 Tax=Fulvivirga maritima TaxID=2904247 RepID=UPI001F34B37C|nr:hypothetical protein [Fulvivirga maritima]UII26006.1 hypothetical protein LVD15_22300 [Fulvivirga maritima]